MNTISTQKEFSGPRPRDASVSTVETYWGYILRANKANRSQVILLQWSTAFLGVSLLLAALGLWVLPGSTVASDVLGFKLGLTTVILVLGMLMVRFASNGTNYEVQVDSTRKELREALRNNQGKARIMKRIKFEDMDAVYIDRSKGAGSKARLMVRMAASPVVIEVACDYEEHLTQMHERLGAHILGAGAQNHARANRGFKFKAATGVIAPVTAASTGGAIAA